MSATNFRLGVETDELARAADNPLLEYPDISDTDLARLEWSVTGRFKIASAGEPLTVGVDKTPGWLADYVWIRVMAFNRQFKQAVEGDESEDGVLDNPGTVRFTPQNGSIRVVFIYPEDGEQRQRAASVPTTAVGEAVIAATETLREELLGLNQQLRDSRLIGELDERIEETRGLLD